MTEFRTSRRHLLAGTAGLVLSAGVPINPHAAMAAESQQDLAALAEDAAIWGLPLVQTGRYVKLAHAQGYGFNRFYLHQGLATPAMKLIGPNVDTIYGFAWLDLSHGPFVLDVPDAADRYYSIQFTDAYENSFAYVGRRATGTKAGRFVIAESTWQGDIPAGAKRIDAPTSLLFVLTRTLVRGDADLPAAQALQAGYLLGPLQGYPASRKAPIALGNVPNNLPILDFSHAGAGYFAELDRLVKLYPPRGPEARSFARFAPLGLGQGFAEHPPLPADKLEVALARALKRIKAVSASDDNDGWRVNYHITPFIADPVARAAGNAFGPGAHIAEEALYFNATNDAEGGPLTGARRYTLTFPKGQLPPAHAFWSLILYGRDFLLVDNPINRYAINDRTPGLVYEPDGSLRILIQHDAPQGPANWLPAPAGGFRLILRTYQPDESLRSGKYRVPKLIAA